MPQTNMQSRRQNICLRETKKGQAFKMTDALCQLGCPKQQSVAGLQIGTTVFAAFVCHFFSGGPTLLPVGH